MNPDFTPARRSLIPKLPQCYICSQRAVNRCEFPGCLLWLCQKHCIRKAGGFLCYEHRKARLVQDESLPGENISGESVPSTRFKNAGESIFP